MKFLEKYWWVMVALLIIYIYSNGFSLRGVIMTGDQSGGDKSPFTSGAIEVTEPA